MIQQQQKRKRKSRCIAIFAEMMMMLHTPGDRGGSWMHEEPAQHPRQHQRRLWKAAKKKNGEEGNSSQWAPKEKIDEKILQQ